MPSLPVVELFSQPGCHLCDEAKRLLHTLQATYPFTFREVNIADDASLLAQYGEEIPVVFVNGQKTCKYRVDVAHFIRRLQRAHTASSPAWWQRVGRRRTV